MTFLEERDLDNVPSIPEYYRGKTIFITGGSGFMGKVLVEKLLFSCTELDRIYLLLRTKKNVKPEDRLSAVYRSMCFDRLRKERPGVFESKVFFIAGDVSDSGLGMSEEDRALIVNRTQIIFHVAASVRFDDPLKVSTKLNLFGTKEITELAKDMRSLESLVHVSTSYSNTNREPVEEIMYPPLGDWRETLEITEKADDHTLRVLTSKFIGDMPNTYVFTKQLAEHVVYEQKGKLPCVIIRPSIVISSHKEPIAGWIENFNGPAGIIVACGKGILRTFYSSPDNVADFIPVDVAIKACIAASWIRGTKKLEPTDDIPIYNDCAGTLSHFTFQELVTLGLEIVAKEPLDNMFLPPRGTFTASQLRYNLDIWILHVLPALLIDMILWVSGRKPMLTRIQRRIYNANQALRYYLTQQWTFCNKNFLSLRSNIKETDQQAFYYDIENIDRYDYYRQCCNGGRKYLLKEKEENHARAKLHYNRLRHSYPAVEMEMRRDRQLQIKHLTMTTLLWNHSFSITKNRMIFAYKVITALFYCWLFWWIVNTNYVQSIFKNTFSI